MVSKNEERLADYEHEASLSDFASTVLGNVLSEAALDEEKERNEQLSFLIKQNLEPNQSEESTILEFVKSSLKIEFPMLTSEPEFDNMTQVIAEGVLHNEHVKDEVIDYTSKILQEKLNLSVKTKH